MHILELVSSLDVGGVEQLVISLAREFPRHGVASQIGCLVRLGRLVEQNSISGIWIGGLNEKRPFVDIRVLLQLCRFVRVNQITIIHSHNTRPLLYGALASWITGASHVNTVHGKRDIHAGRQAKTARTRRLLRFGTKAYVAVSRALQSELCSVERLPAVQVCVIPNGINTMLFQPGSGNAQLELRHAHAIPSNAFVIGTVGRFSAEKDYPLLIQAFRQFHDQAQDAHLVLVGDGPERGPIQQAIQSSGLSDVCHLPGMQTNVVKWMQMLDVFCLSSKREGAPLTLLEAGACGLPLVATDVGANRELINPPECGLIVPPGHAQQLTQAWLHLYRNRDLGHQMGARARQRVLQHYSLTEMTRSYCRLFREITNIPS